MTNRPKFLSRDYFAALIDYKIGWPNTEYESGASDLKKIFEFTLDLIDRNEDLIKRNEEMEDLIHRLENELDNYDYR